jgi:hypothetical protein
MLRGYSRISCSPGMQYVIYPYSLLCPATSDHLTISYSIYGVLTPFFCGQYNAGSFIVAEEISILDSIILSPFEYEVSILGDRASAS